jgi:hypothetical protein
LRVSGHVFHPGHDDLHGTTVIIAGASGRTYVGRWHERDARGVVMRDVAIHDPAAAPLDRHEWLARQRRFGVAATEKYLLLPNDEAGDVTPFDVAE